ncbi:MAG: CRISPR-associated helicase Cas3' [Candidatus Eremiobacteraeota bacterium]|nr:CRISPR-associated helicase Cas3' [Candidatus Eremiobacteraeota bacterium]
MKNFEKIFKIATGNQPYPYQKKLALNRVLPQVLEVPTGAGKTSAVTMTWVWRRCFASDEVKIVTPRRLIYCLPMRVLVEQTFDCIAKWLKRLEKEFLPGEKPELVKLLGGEIGSSEFDWANYPEKNMIVVGTQDMLLSRALNRGYGASIFRCPKEFGIINNDCLWVIDEIQLMGSGLATTVQLQAFREMLGTIGCAGTVWMSATLQKDWLTTVDFDSHQKISTEEKFSIEAEDRANTHLKKRLIARKVPVKTESKIENSKGLAKEVFHHHEKGTRTIAVLNTVKRAKELYGEINKLCKDKKNIDKSGVRLVLLHSHFRPGDRKEALDRALDKPEEPGTIVVSTQVIEAGVDISSRTLFTELAPWASMVQRFGRCNRKGEYEKSDVFWIDEKDNQSQKDMEKNALPYKLSDLRASKRNLIKLEYVSPDSLRELDIGYEMEHGLVLRKKDLVELFDTTPDLTGLDIDISRFIRETDEFNVQVFWRDFEGEEPSKDEPSPDRKELCTAPIGDVRGLIKESKKKKKVRFWKWDFLEKKWEEIQDEREVFPGITLMLHSKTGFYTKDLGWSLKRKGEFIEPIPVPAEATQQRSLDGDELSEGKWMTIKKHTDLVVNEAKSILQNLSIPVEHRNNILEAARWHDAGKAHEIFQKTMRGWDKDKNNDKDIKIFTKPPPPEIQNQLLAKCPKHNIGHERPGFRHELASGILALTHGKDDLVAYLAAAHHGKVRLSIRSFPGESKPPKSGTRFARGIWDKELVPPKSLNGETFNCIDVGGGVEIPPTPIDLSYMELGDTNSGESWLSRMLRLRDSSKIGTFRLAFFENIIKSADERASGGK